MASKCRLLVAVTTMGYAHARRALADVFDLVPVFSLSQARAALKDGGINAVLASIHFDDSHMFELMAEVNALNPRPPFVCCILLGTSLGDATVRGLVDAAAAQGCAGFLNYSRLQRKVGFAEADKQFRRELLQLLPPPCGSVVATA